MPSSFFSPKSAGTRFLTSLCNLILVNLLFILSSIPIFTLGASVTSLYRITIAILAGDNPSVIKDYFKCFKDNFLKATGLLLLYSAVTAFFVFELYMIRIMLDESYQWTSFIPIFFLVAIAASSFYSFPLLAWFDESFKQLLKNSILIALSNLPVTIMYIAISAGFAFLVYQFPTITMSIMVFMGFSTMALFYSIFLKRIFEKLGAVISFKEDKEDTDKM
ncbi:MAG: DUF624 domain-containing protein [Clostridiales bacterium]|nr:DUF624 domain-containing protein [Clostridiales bacterium]